jgi:DNA-directed RNA polymerase specialized sigma24 family protein
MPRNEDRQPQTTESRLHDAVVRFNAGDPAAENDLLGHVRHRLMVITRKQLRGDGGFARVARWNETDDVVQEVCLRLADLLRKEPLNTGDHFLRLAAKHIRWALVNLHHKVSTKSHFSATLETDTVRRTDSARNDRLALAAARTDSLFRWDKFLARFETLSPEQRQMLDDVFFNGCTREETAARLGIGITAFKDRWRKLKLQLGDEGFTQFN